MKTLFFRAGLLVLCVSGLIAQPRTKLSLPDAINIALKRNTRILLAQKEIEIARGKTFQSGRIANPEVGIEVNGISNPLQIDQADEFSVGLKQEFEFPGKRSLRIETESVQEELANLETERLRIVISAKVKEQYTAVLLEQANIAYNKEQLESLDDISGIAKSQFGTGTARYLDVLRLNVEHAKLLNDINESMRRHADTRTKLSQLLGGEDLKETELSDSLSTIPQPLDSAAVLQSLVAGSILLRAAEREQAQRTGAIRLAQMSYLPDFSLGVSYQRRTGQPPFNTDNFSGGTSSSMGISVGISIPLWYQHEQRGQVLEAEAFAEAGQIERGAVVQNVRSSIISAIRTVQSSKAQLEVFTSSLLADADAVLSSGITEYRNGQLDIAGILDIYRASRAARIEYVRTVALYATALAMLESSGNINPGE